MRMEDRYDLMCHFFTYLFHEFGTPLTLISTSVEHLSANAADTGINARYIRALQSNTAWMQRLISDIMDFEKVEGGIYKPQYSRFDVKALLYEILENFSEINERKAINLFLDCPKEGMEIISDNSIVEKILTELTANAYKYTPDGGEIKIGLSSSDKGITFTIRNSGEGIRKEDIQKVFDRFAVLDTYERRSKGDRVARNGLGLPLAWSLSKMLSGSIEVESERGTYTTFSLRLPRENESKIGAEDSVAEMNRNDITIEYEEALETGSCSRQNKKLALIVGNERKMLNILSDILSSEYRVITADSGHDAGKLIKQETPEVILSEMNMPVFSGIEFLRDVKSNRLTMNIPFVLIASKYDIDREVSAYELGCDGIIHKPFNSRQLKAMLNGVLEKRENLKAYYTSMISNLESFDSKVIKSEDKDFLAMIVNIVEGNLMNSSFNIEALASAMCMSKAKLYSKLKKLVDKSPSEFVMAVKINHVAHLLRTTDQNVQEIMYSSGFNNKSYFFREFKKNHGVTPQQYRDAHHEDVAEISVI